MTSFATLNPSEFIKPVHSIEAEVYTASKTGASADCRGWAHAVALISLGTISSSNTGTIKIQQSSDDGSVDTFADISGAAYTLTGDDDDTVKAIAVRLHGKERYLRALYTETATGQSSAISVVICLVGPQDSTNDNTFTYSGDVL